MKATNKHWYFCIIQCMVHWDSDSRPAAQHRYEQTHCLMNAAFQEHSATRLYRFPNASGFLITFITHWFFGRVREETVITLFYAELLLSVVVLFLNILILYIINKLIVLVIIFQEIRSIYLKFIFPKVECVCFASTAA